MRDTLSPHSLESGNVLRTPSFVDPTVPLKLLGYSIRSIITFNASATRYLCCSATPCPTRRTSSPPVVSQAITDSESQSEPEPEKAPESESQPMASSTPLESHEATIRAKICACGAQSPSLRSSCWLPNSKQDSLAWKLEVAVLLTEDVIEVEAVDVSDEVAVLVLGALLAELVAVDVSVVKSHAL